jgi:hypothetical protein
MFEKGQHVICTSDQVHPEIKYLYKQWIEKGKCYTIRDCTLGTTNVFAAQENVSYKVLLEELVNDIDPFTTTGCREELGFRSDRFVPVDELTEEEENRELVGVGTENKPHWL